MAKPLRYRIQEIPIAPESRVVVDRANVGAVAQAPLSGPAQMDDLPDIAGLSTSLMHAYLAVKKDSIAKDLNTGRGLGQEAVLHGDSVSAASGKLIPANANANVVSGYWQSVARAFAREESANQIELGRSSYEQMAAKAKGGGASSLPLSLDSVQSVMGRATKTLTDQVRLANPELFSNQYFVDELTSAREPYQERSFSSLLALRNGHTQSIITGSQMLEARAVLNGQVDGTEPANAVADWIKSSSFAGNTAAAEMLSKAAEQGINEAITFTADGFPIVDKARAQGILASLREARINGVSMAEGEHADNFLRLSQRVNQALNPSGSDERRADAFIIERWATDGSDLSVLQRMTNKPEATLFVQQRVGDIMSGAAGVPAAFREPLVKALQAILPTVGQVDVARADAVFDSVSNLVREGRFDDAAKVANELTGLQESAALDLIANVRENADKVLNGMPAFAGAVDLFEAHSKEAGVNGHPLVVAAQTGFRDAVTRAAWATVAQARTPNEMAAASKLIDGVAAAYAPKVAKAIEGALAPFNALRETMLAKRNAGASFEQEIHIARSKGQVSSEQATRLLQMDNSNNAELKEYRTIGTENWVEGITTSAVMRASPDFRWPTKSGKLVLFGDGALAVQPILRHVDGVVLAELASGAIKTSEDLRRIILRTVSALTEAEIKAYARGGTTHAEPFDFAGAREIQLEFMHATVLPGQRASPELTGKMTQQSARILGALAARKDMPVADRTAHVEALIRLSGAEPIYASDIIEGIVVVNQQSVPIGAATFDSGFLYRQPMFDTVAELEMFLRKGSNINALSKALGIGLSVGTVNMWRARQRALVTEWSNR